MEKQPFDGYKPNLFPRIQRAGEAIRTVLRAGHVTELCLSEHKRGAAEMLDNAMDNQPELPFEKYDDMGCYIDRSRS